MQQVKNDPELADTFCKLHPIELLYVTLLNYMRRKTISMNRNSDYTVYSHEGELLVVLWSTLRGNTTCKIHETFCFTTIPYYSY